MGDIELQTVTAQPLIGASSTTAKGNVSGPVMALLSGVWEKIRASKVETLGINVFIYTSNSRRLQELGIFAGVLVSGSHEPPPGLEAIQTPSGRAAHAVHFGDYAELGRVNGEILDWCRKTGQALTGVSWEVYGHHEDDPAKRRTDIYYQVR